MSEPDETSVRIAERILHELSQLSHDELRSVASVIAQDAAKLKLFEALQAHIISSQS